jgi:hypothetical protein
MRKLSYLFAVAAIGGLTSLASGTYAGPMAGSLTRAHAAVPAMNDGLVQNVHGWHCRRRFSKRLGWHRHRRACYDYDDYDDYDDYGYYPYYYPYYATPYPFFSFSFGDFDRHHHRRHHRRKHW